MRGFTCPICKKKLDEQYAYTIDINEKNWPCPDCGKISRRVVTRVDNYNNYESHYLGCLECRPIMKYVTPTDRICGDCVSNANWGSILDDKKQKNWQLVLPTAIISLVIGFFLGWLFFRFRRLRKGKTTSPFKK